MALRLYNTLTHREEPFIPREPGRVTMYFCGPTVYNYTHIGHLRPALLADVLARYFKAQGYAVLSLANFTDVDDRLIDKAIAEGTTVTEVAQRYIDDYLENMAYFGVNQVDRYVNATDHIAQMITMIRELLAKDFAYEIEGDVYFDVTRKPDYGKLSGRSLDELQSGARVQVDARKRNPMDFALWKAAKPGEPAWDSPWGPGRPGWHIECSAMSLEYLRNGFDIHGGGDDLVFPHHENEIAQSEAFTGKAPFARYWLHNAMVQVDKEKMSKSLNNFTSLRDLRQRFRPGVVRLYLLSTHYRKPLNFSLAGLEEAQRGFERLANTLQRAEQTLGGLPPVAAGAAAPSARHENLAQEAERQRASFMAALDDDINTAKALSCLFDLARATNTLLAQGAAVDPAGLAAAAATLRKLGDILGLWHALEVAGDGQSAELVSELVDLLLSVREDARRRRDWPMSDRIRDRLQELGIAVEDTAAGPRWKRVQRS